MKAKDEQKTIVCYGEVLWDIFPSITKPGGAPMNVAYHLHKMGINSHMISCVGNDKQGSDLLNVLNNWGISTGECQIDPNYPTGYVEAIVGEDKETRYIIHENVAWDNISSSAQFDEIVSQADAFVFGTLAARSKTSRDTLYALIEKAKYKVFDVNLRPPFYTREVLEYLLSKCNLLKLNYSELQLIISWYKEKNDEEAEDIKFLQERFGISEIIVTKGSQGASYYDGLHHYFFPAFKVDVKDTVGSGDSFLAAFLSRKINQDSIEKVMLYATALGAFVTTQEGACPSYETETFNRFMDEKINISIKK